VTSDELRTALALGREQRNVEFKGPGSRTDKAFCAKITRAILGMANTPDGGVVVLGVDDDGTTLSATGLTSGQTATWGYDDLQSSVSNYADPYADLDVAVVLLDKKEFVAIHVWEFSDMPVLCKRDYTPTLRDGALYVRRRGKNETVEVPSHTEMREVVERAAIITARKEQASATASPVIDRFAQEAGDLL
jgi:predicted HTH transcriptional regulator